MTSLRIPNLIRALFALYLSLSLSHAFAGDAKLFQRISPGQSAWTAETAKNIARTNSTLEVKSSIAVSVNRNALTQDLVAIDIESGSVQVSKTGSRQLANHTEWYGATSDKSGHLILTIEDKKVSGSFRQGGKYFLIQPTSEPNISLIKEVRVTPAAADSNEEVTKPPEIRRINEEERKNMRDSSAKPLNSFRTSASGEDVIDVLLVIPAATRAVANTTGTPIETFAANWMAELNNSLNWTGTYARLVDIYSITSFEDSATMKPILDALALRADVRMRRNFVGADVVIMAVPGYRAENGRYICGVAYAGPDNDYAYGVVGFNPSTCGPIYTFAHEVGHLLGAGHNKSAAHIQTGDAHGYPDLGDNIRGTIGQNWCGRTLMATDVVAQADPNCANLGYVIPTFSDPTRGYAYWTIGIHGVANNTRAVAANRLAVATFRQQTLAGGEVASKAKKMNAILTTTLYTDLIP